MAGPVDATLRKFHASLNVSDLHQSIAFYRELLGVEPAKVRADYAKFELAEPALVLSLVPGRPGTGGHLNHAGLRVRSAEELVEIQRRLEAAGMPTQREDGVECCYARQTKFWISDPDGALWEIYVFHDDIDDHGKATMPCVEPLAVKLTGAAPTRTWEHRLREPVPSRVPFDDNTLQEVRLEGSINLAEGTDHLDGLFGEALRALRPHGTIHVHGLAGDRRCSAAIALPGPAAAVQHVPAVSDVVGELARAGFVDVRIETLSQTAHFVVDGVPMRELRVAARKPGHRPGLRTHQAVYLGPLSEITDDFGTVFRRGVPTSLNIHDWQLLAKSAASGSFLFLQPESAKTEGCCTEDTAAPSGATASR